MNIEERIKAFSALGKELKAFMGKISNTSPDLHGEEEQLLAIVNASFAANSWFTKQNILQALAAWSDQLEESNLRQWLAEYNPAKLQPAQPRKVGVIMAGNIPLVGFHDMLSVLISGHIMVGKTASQDALLLPYLAERLVAIEPRIASFIRFLPRLNDIEAVIATGSNNSARYFEYYFGKYPHIIRSNRNSAAVLNGRETPEELNALGHDIFDYFGLGCRNVSKLFIPEDYVIDRFYEAMEPFHDIYNHNKYANNYDYNRAVYLLNKETFLDNNFLMLREVEALASPVAVVFYERYKNDTELRDRLLSLENQLQCIVANDYEGAIPFGKAQQPSLWDYADRVDTMHFLCNL